jgi:hypothetical protein
MQVRNFKSGFAAAFFYLCVCCCSVIFTVVPNQAYAQPVDTDSLKALSSELNLSTSSTWKALLHADGEHPNIQDPNFLLSHSKFSLKRELELTIDVLYSGHDEQLCRFPARYLWLQKQLDSPKLAIEKCADLTEFKNKAPAEKISLSFASENLSQPSSTMGHLFLKLEGMNGNGKRVEHAISFFTDGDSINFPKLLFDSTVIGKNGYFTLSPYKEKLDLYVKDEQRSVWEYQLRLSPFTKELIQNHLIELKQSKLVYFFQKYNCATVIDFVIALAIPETKVAEGLWISPKDVVKRADKAGLINSTINISPNRWIIRALNEQLGNDVIASVKTNVDQLTPLDIPDRNQKSAKTGQNEILELELARAYHDYRLEADLVSASSWAPYATYLQNTLESKYPNAQLETKNYKNPLYTPQDSQISVGITRRHQINYASFSFLPASHRLEDDNRQYFGENSMQLFETTVLKNLTTSQVEIDRLTFFKVQSLIPHNAMTGGITSKFNIAYEPIYLGKTLTTRMFAINGALGKTIRVARDIDIYSTLGIGATFTKKNGMTFTEIEAGFIAREIWNMKTIFNMSSKVYFDGSKDPVHSIQLRQSKYFENQAYSAHLTLSSDRYQNREVKQMDLILKKIF